MFLFRPLTPRDLAKVLEQANYLFERSFVLSQRTGQKGAWLWLTVHQGYHFLRMGDYGRARDRFIESQQNFMEADNIIGVVFALEGLSSLFIRREYPEEALRILAWADETRNTIKNPRFPVDQLDMEEDLNAIREMIDEQTFATAYAAGKAMTMEEAIALALEIDKNAMP